MENQSLIYSNSQLISKTIRQLNKLPLITREFITYQNSNLISETVRKLGELPRVKREAIIYSEKPFNLILQIISA